MLYLIAGSGEDESITTQLQVNDTFEGVGLSYLDGSGIDLQLAGLECC